MDEGLFGSILPNEIIVVMPLITLFFAPFWGMDGAFKLSVEKLIPILDFIPWKKTVSMEYNVVQSDEWIIFSETKF